MSSMENGNLSDLARLVSCDIDTHTRYMMSSMENGNLSDLARLVSRDLDSWRAQF